MIDKSTHFIQVCQLLLSLIVENLNLQGNGFAFSSLNTLYCVAMQMKKFNP